MIKTEVLTPDVTASYLDLIGASLGMYLAWQIFYSFCTGESYLVTALDIHDQAIVLLHFRRGFDLIVT